ncbi:hypothetical protein JTE90_001368 [Oedothorax gibbosus]|uniref:Uncharacterized protein n=1 Tax=Oedothorax gibbosus TaxID=931172 RepID=A0AAV6VF69_9ARAC|nr:hypothetical protein JTE90_001368 [Oedothorax gibbosus]
MLSTKHQSILLACLVISCSLVLPVVSFGGNHHDHHGLEVLLAAGLLAKLLKQHHKHEVHHVHIPVPVHHHEEHHGHHEEHHGHHGHHGSGSARVPVMRPPVPHHYPVVPMQHLYGGVPMMGAHSMMARRVMYVPPQARDAPFPCPLKH